MSAPTAAVDLLNSLLEAELNSIFRFMGEGSTYLGRATVEVRRPLQEMVLAERRRAAELAERIQLLGGDPGRGIRIRSEEQYLAFLSLQFLLPKLVAEKKLHIERYENALTSVRTMPDAQAEVGTLVSAHLAELRGELASLETAAAQVSRPKKSAPAKPPG
jgi:bacterioferritin (cytochrome b1)